MLMVLIVPFLVALSVVTMFALCGVAMYNGLMTYYNQALNAWTQIDVQLKRRYDLIPNLVKVSAAYLNHESRTMIAVTEARASALKAQTLSHRQDAENSISSTLGRFLTVSEHYPDLKANANFQALHTELTETEDRISYSRQHYNDAVMFYENRRASFPSNLIASCFGFVFLPYWKPSGKEHHTAPHINFE